MTIVLSIDVHKQTLEAMVQAGASGYVLKDDTFTNLTRAIRAGAVAVWPSQLASADGWLRYPPRQTRFSTDGTAR